MQYIQKKEEANLNSKSKHERCEKLYQKQL